LRHERSAEGLTLNPLSVAVGRYQQLEQRPSQLSKPKLLIVDEFGYLPFKPTAAHLLFQPSVIEGQAGCGA